jgi:hypothetical protein
MKGKTGRYCAIIEWWNGGPRVRFLSSDMRDIEQWMREKSERMAGIKAFVVKDAEQPLAATVHDATLTRSWTLNFAEATP